jgi:hypothetical protein
MPSFSFAHEEILELEASPWHLKTYEMRHFSSKLARKAMTAAMKEMIVVRNSAVDTGPGEETNVLTL